MLQKELRKLILPFLVPNIIIYLVITLWPNIIAFYWSLTKYNGLTPAKYVGLDNFRYMLTDDRWWGAVGNTFYFAIGSIITLIPFGILFAFLIMNTKRMNNFYRTTVYFPSILSLVIVALLWIFILDADIGLFNQALKSMNLTKAVKELLDVNTLNWLGHPKLTRPSILFVQLWSALGYYTLLFMAGLAKIPQELIEAARMDGAEGWKLFRHVTWPLLFPTTQTVLVLTVIASLQIFTLIYVLGGGTAALSPVTQVMATYIYKSAFTDTRYGYATALSIIMMVVVMFFTILSRQLTKREIVQF